MVQQVLALRRQCKCSEKGQDWPPDQHSRENGPVNLKRSIYVVNGLKIVGPLLSERPRPPSQVFHELAQIDLQLFFVVVPLDSHF